MQLSFFDNQEEFKINKPIRLIELFAGYGSQHFALEYIGANFESWKICEWAVKSIQAYKDAHFKEDNNDYSKKFTKEQLFNYLTNKGISANYNEPMSYEQVKRLGEQKARIIYNNIKATHNLVNIQQVKGEDLEIVDTDKYCYIMTYSFPCQDLSLAGLGKGMSKDGGTRSGMLWEVERILTELKQQNRELPQVLLMENVPQVHGRKNKDDFDTWIDKLKELGYSNYWQDLNAKNYGVPQNRNRCFMVSLLGDYSYQFPKEKELEILLKDILEDEVDEKYYLSEKALNGCLNTNFDCNKLDHRLPKNGIMPTICARDYKDPKLVEITNNKSQGYRKTLKNELCNKLIQNGLVKENDIIRHSYSNNRLQNGDKNMGRIESKEHLSPTLDTRCDCLGVCVKDNNSFVAKKIDKYLKDHKELPKFFNPYNCADCGYIAPTQTTCCGSLTSSSTVLIKGKNKIDTSNMNMVYNDLRIRKLTPKECFRLMGVKDEDFEKIAENQSNASLYHLAGDSIVVDVLMAIFNNLF